MLSKSLYFNSFFLYANRSNSGFILSFLSHPAHFYASLIHWFFFTHSSNHASLKPLRHYPSLPLPAFLSQGANSLILCSWRTAGNNGGVGLVVVATGMRQERESGRQKRKAWRERARSEGMQVVSRAAGSKWRLITLVSMHNAIKPRCTPPSLRITSGSHT